MQALFSASLVPPRSFTRSLALSAAFHCLMIGASLKVAEHFRESGWKAILRGYTVEPIRVMVPGRLYYPRQAARSAAPGKRVTASRRPASAPRPAPVRTLLEGPVIIQPQPQPMAITAALRVAGVLSWTAKLPDPPKPDASRPIVPGRREESAAIETPVPPRLDIPNREPRFSQLNIAAAPAPELPALPVAPGGTTPVEIASETRSDTRSNALDSFNSDPANLLILGGNSAPRNEVFTVPPGTRMGGGEPAPARSAVTREPAPRDEEANVRAEESKVRDGETGLRADATTPASASGIPARPAGERQAAPAHGNESRAAAGETNPHAAGILPPGVVAPAAASPAPASPPPIRKTNPGDGKFDVVILQSSPGENFAGGAAVLAGRPVYSVYLNVGTPRAWVLQFCLVPTVRQPAAAETTVIVLGKAERVEGPYPLSTVIPTLEPASSSRHTLFHGYVGANGRFRDLRAVTMSDLRAQQILSYLHQWEFRPATRDDEPVDVEILLAIPPNGI